MVDETHEPLIRVAALHALVYCERLFYLEEVEELRLADANVFAGRSLHEELAQEDIDRCDTLQLSSESLGLTGKLDAVRRRDGSWFPYEHKKGRAFKTDHENPAAWATDALQVCAYGLLMEEALGVPILEGRIRYHADNLTVRVQLDAALRGEVTRAVDRARQLRSEVNRPAVTPHAGRCLRCSLAPVCLPEEERLSQSADWETVRLFPPKRDGQTVHILAHRSQAGRRGDTLCVHLETGEDQSFPIQEVAAVVVHGNSQITTQALHLCAAHDIAVHWISTGGRYLCGSAPGTGAVQRRIRQYRALSDAEFPLVLARRLVHARVESQLRYLLRATRGDQSRRCAVRPQLMEIRAALARAAHARSIETLRGEEGTAGRAYFSALPHLLSPETDPLLRPLGRSRRPPRDRFNALLSFGYALLYRAVLQAVVTVGLEPALGFFHTPRSAAHPLVLDMMELFRVPVWDITLIGSVNRRQWDPAADFEAAKDHVWLSENGRRKAISLFETRLLDVWRHPVTEYSLSWERAMELEVRLLEKEWCGQPGLFARARLR